MASAAVSGSPDRTLTPPDTCSSAGPVLSPELTKPGGASTRNRPCDWTPPGKSLSGLRARTAPWADDVDEAASLSEKRSISWTMDSPLELTTTAATFCTCRLTCAAWNSAAETPPLTTCTDPGAVLNSPSSERAEDDAKA